MSGNHPTSSRLIVRSCLAGCAETEQLLPQHTETENWRLSSQEPRRPVCLAKHNFVSDHVTITLTNSKSGQL